MASSVFTDARSVQLVVTNQLGNATTTTITEPVPTLTQPTGDGVINLGHGGQETCSWLDLLFFGVGTDSQMFAANVYGWELEKSQSGKHDLWIPRYWQELRRSRWTRPNPALLARTFQRPIT